MVDSESDTENVEYDSARSSLILPSSKQTRTQSPLKRRSTDRLYSVASSRQTHPDEYTSLLSSGTRSYHSTPLHEIPDPFDQTTSIAPMGILRRKISRVFQSKAYDYDSNKNSLAAVGSGERVWYFARENFFDLKGRGL